GGSTGRVRWSRAGARRPRGTGRGSAGTARTGCATAGRERVRTERAPPAGAGRPPELLWRGTEPRGRAGSSRDLEEDALGGEASIDVEPQVPAHAVEHREGPGGAPAERLR